MINRDLFRLNSGGKVLLAAVGIPSVIFSMAMVIICATHACAQDRGPELEFDAVSVKPSNPNSTNGTVVNMTRGGRLHVVNATVRDLIETAYDVRSFQIEGGPKWAGGSKFDVDATPGIMHPSDPQTTPPGSHNVRLEVQALLKDRFRLQLHRVTKTGSILSLAIAKGGIKVNALSATQSPQRGITAGQGTILGEAASMAQLAYKLSRLLQRPVVNNTGLEGNYDFKLEWTPDAAPSAPDQQPPETSIGPSVFSAIQQQLGLRLEATKGSVDVLLIDHVEKPSEN